MAEGKQELTPAQSRTLVGLAEPSRHWHWVDPSVPSKILVYPEPQSVTLFGNRVFIN